MQNLQRQKRSGLSLLLRANKVISSPQNKTIPTSQEVGIFACHDISFSVGTPPPGGPGRVDPSRRGDPCGRLAAALLLRNRISPVRMGRGFFRRERPVCSSGSCRGRRKGNGTQAVPYGSRTENPVGTPLPGCPGCTDPSRRGDPCGRPYGLMDRAYSSIRRFRFSRREIYRSRVRRSSSERESRMALYCGSISSSARVRLAYSGSVRTCSRRSQ